ncbi:jerky protein homolog-like [Leptopilina heterotoma]|uniref:jerky protein homolog-like n=1 Tax=Leptopilina heterotoma TaxID=63436 RepID=UPI001CA987E1|nr:jerky protein homolog-like [Leptopilina heterotoma]
MTRELYKQWITTVFLPSVRKFQNERGVKKKVLLVVDNARCHLSKEETELIDDMIIVQNLPLNVTSLIQPMDQGVMQKMKQLYKKSLLREMLLVEDKLCVLKFLKERNILHCCIQISQAWSELTSTNICRAWRKLIPACDIDLENKKDMSEDDILQILYRLPGFQNITVDQVSSWLEVDSMIAQNLVVMF